MKLRHLLFFLFFSVFANAQTVVDIIVNSDDHNTLETAVIEADLAATLAGDGPFTVFAPTDEAFDALPEGTLDAVLADPMGVLTDILLYHTVGATALSSDLSDGQVITTLNGADVIVTINADGVFINDAQVTVADLNATNGVVHVIDAVLLPPAQVDLPITFEETDVDYALGDFGNNFSIIVEDPTDPENTVVQTTKPDNAELWAGTTAGVDGLANPVPFAEGETKMTVRVWSPTAGTPILLKAEAANDPTISVETLTNTTVAMQWETLEFDFSNEAPETSAIDFSNTYDKVSIFFNFGTDGMTAGEQTYFWDDVKFGPKVTVVDIVVNSEDHNTLEAAVIAADLAGTLSGNGPFTLFAPTDDAFTALPEGTVEALLEDPMGQLTDILLYHAVAGTALSTDLMDGMEIETINGASVTVTINTDGVFINDAQVTVADIETDNGVVHVIDAVLLPPAQTVVDIIVASEDHNILETAVIAAGLDAPLSEEGPFTVFAPTDAAFNVLGQEVIDALLADPTGDLSTILQYHVTNANIGSGDLSNRLIGTSINGFDYLITLNGSNAFVNNAQITVTDLEGSNGVVHVIDAILVPNTTASTIVNSPDFSILANVLIATGLINNLNDLETTTTLFAPSDQAFSVMPEDVLEALVNDPDKLTNALLYHVAAERTFADELSDGQEITTLLGETAEITVNAEGVFINDAQIFITDFFTGNGIIHAIDAVLLPAPETVMDVVIQSDVHNTLQAAIEAAGLDETLQGEGTFTVFAPTDAAFEMLPEGTVEALLADPEGQLTDILLYHVLGNEVLSTDLMDGASAETINGASVNVSIIDGEVFINDAKVVIADIQTDNGVVHVIDMVLLPPTSTVEIAPEEATIYPNPAANFFTVQFDNDTFENPTLDVVDVKGQLVKRVMSFQANDNVNIGNLQPGIYNVVITDGVSTLTKRIVKIK